VLTTASTSCQIREFRATLSSVGILRKQPKQSQASDWIQPGQMISELGGPPGTFSAAGPPVPVRMRPLPAIGNTGWLRGALILSPGSLMWKPESGVSAEPVELAAATILPPQDAGGGKHRPGMAATILDVETSAGRFELEMDSVLFEMSQELVAEAAAQQDPGDPGMP
jgi:hypothetical protein